MPRKFCGACGGRLLRKPFMSSIAFPACSPQAPPKFRERRQLQTTTVVVEPAIPCETATRKVRFDHDGRGRTALHAAKILKRLRRAPFERTFHELFFAPVASVQISRPTGATAIRIGNLAWPAGHVSVQRQRPVRRAAGRALAPLSPPKTQHGLQWPAKLRCQNPQGSSRSGTVERKRTHPSAGGGTTGGRVWMGFFHFVGDRGQSFSGASSSSRGLVCSLAM
jgi:hypothetical protein